MGQYINPPDRVLELGRSVELRGTLIETRAQLSDDELLVMVAIRPFGLVALVIASEHDFLCVAAEPSQQRFGIFVFLRNLIGISAPG